MKVIMSVVRNNIDTSLQEEIEAAIRLKLEHLPEEEIDNAITAYL